MWIERIIELLFKHSIALCDGGNLVPHHGQLFKFELT